MSWFSEALAAGDLSAFAVMSDLIKYHAGSTIINTAAIPGNSSYWIESGEAGAMKLITSDFIVPVSALANEPKRGDEITFQGRRFEVLEPAGVPCWQYSDLAKSFYRIHTKEIERLEP